MFGCSNNSIKSEKFQLDNLKSRILEFDQNGIITKDLISRKLVFNKDSSTSFDVWIDDTIHRPIVSKSFIGGKIAWERNYFENNDSFIIKEYYSSGSTQKIKSHSYRSHYGLETIFFQSGKVLITQELYNEKQNGFRKTYYKNGKLRRIEHYQNEAITDTTTCFDSIGNIKSQWLYLEPCSASMKCKTLLLK